MKSSVAATDDAPGACSNTRLISRTNLRTSASPTDFADPMIMIETLTISWLTKRMAMV